MKLYIYDHCPYCVKARMIFGLKNIPVELQILANDDVETPERLIGQKMVPILQKDDGSYMPESMDIVHFIDNYDHKPLLTGSTNPAISAWLRKVTEYTPRLIIPRFAQAAFEEFASTSARQYFVNKKETQLGNFADHLGHSQGLIKKLNHDLQDLDPLIAQPNACNGVLSTDDIDLFPLLRSLSIVAGVTPPSRVADYRNNMAKQTQVTLLSSLAI